MKIQKINLVYFSATYTTRKIARLAAKQISEKITEYDITQTVPEVDILTENSELLVIAAPVYAGRIPAKAVETFKKFKGNHALAIILCIYGNRDYDDALLEMKDIVENNGFRIVSAGAFIAQHSIFPQVGATRPDTADIEAIHEFGKKSAGIIANLTDLDSLPQIKVKGNKPYKIPRNIPLKPKGDRTCNGCGTCIKLCPVNAISLETPRKTDKALCISCGRCIVVCPNQARHFGGLLYKLVNNRFVKTNSSRKVPDTHFAL